MKKIFFGMMALVAFVATSCQQTLDLEEVGVAGGNLTTVSFNLGTPQIANRAFSDGATATHLQYAVYNANGEILNNLTVTNGDITGGSATVEFQLTTGNYYYVLFWASAYAATDTTAPYQVNLATKTLTVNYDNAVCNDESRDAFFYYSPEPFKVESGMAPIEAGLKRPFAQLNIGTNDFVASANAGHPVNYAKVTTYAYKSLNFATGAVDGHGMVHFGYDAVPGASEVFPVNDAEYDYIAMNYILMASTKETVDVVFTYATAYDSTTGVATNEKQRTVGSVPVQRNHRTNLYGQLFTSNAKVNVSIEEEYDEPMHNKEVYDLKPIYDANGNEVKGIGMINETTYGVTSAEGLQYVANLVDGNTAMLLSDNTTSSTPYTFDGETVVLLEDIDLLQTDENGNIICTKPIGSYRFEKAFKGTLDGQDHTIKNLNQNTWALDNGYYYTDLGMGLFSFIEDATIKNLKIDNADISGESAICGIVAGCAYGDVTFENITVTNSKCADYQYYSGGIVGWASGNHTYRNCNIDASTTIAAQWGDFGNSTGGVIGGAGGSAQILMEDCNVACRIDAYNDVTSAYEYYAYRCCGMLIGNTGKTKVVDGTPYADAPQLTCKNVTVTYGDWANYTYCQFSAMNYPWVRVQAGISNSAYSNPRYGHPTDANGNEVVDDNHAHNEGEGHHVLIEFDQLLGGGPNGNGRSPVYGTKSFEGVTVIYNNK